MLDLLSDLKAEGVTMLLNTHEMGFARDVADEVCFLHDGCIHERGRPTRCSATRSRSARAPSSPGCAPDERRSRG